MQKNLTLFLLGSLISTSILAQGTQLLRQPTISSSDIVFVYANDLWKVKRDGGDAIRMTTNEGYESMPHFSADEKWIAFSAQYDGNTDVYVIPAEGGTPKRLSYHPSPDIVQGWTPDGKVIFRSNRNAHPTRLNQWYQVGMDGGLPVQFEIPRIASGELSPDGGFVAYEPITYWDPEWRNYRGGQAQPIWIVDMKTKDLIRTPRTDNERHLDPVWFDGKIYYLSERDFLSNIWSFDPVSKEEKQITFHKKFDIKSLDASNDAIIYEMGGYLHLLNPKSGISEQLIINVSGDMNFARARWQEVTGENLSNPNLSPNGKRAIFEYRGEIFTFPKEEGSWRNISNTPGVADRFPTWSPKGDQVAWFSDASGEYQLMVMNQYGGDPKSFPLENPTFYFQPDWSPNGKHIAYTDTDYNIWSIELSTGKVSKIDTDRYAHPNRAMNPVWSPDSKWITYAKQLESHFKAVFAHNIETGEKMQLTDGMADAISPVWDQNGKYLYFLASTNYGLNSGWLDMSSYDPQVTRSLYCLILSEDTPSPTLPKSDEEDSKKDDSKKEDKNDDLSVMITKKELSNRIIALDMPSRNYTALLAGKQNSVLITEAIPNETGLKIHKFDLEKMEASEYADNINHAVSSSNGEYILHRSGSTWAISDTEEKPSSDDKINTNAQVKIEPLAEYQQIFREGWRYMRDFLYVDNVHGAPWDQVYSWYSPWIKDVRHRTDLNYMVDILSGEVAVGHSYVSGGDMPDIDRVPVGLLGCDFNLENDFYRISKIYTGERWNPGINGPLSIPGLTVKEGDYITAINGQKLTASDNIYQLLEQTAERTTCLTINSQPASGGTDIFVKPIRDEYQLRTIDWIENNRKKVSQMSDGKLAYVYLPNTGNGGFTNFNRYYFSQQDKKGVILDERNNGGGSAADYMIDVMAREPFGYFNSKANDNRPWTTPMAGIWGPKVMIINERAGSGGDLLPYMFREKKLGPLVGTLTWGGLVGTWDTPRFIDGGRMVAPRGGFYNKNGNWAVEGEGVAPDIEVIQTPKMVMEGKDPQLERAVQEALKLLETEEFHLKPEPPAPVRWKRPEGWNKD
ncbi:PDZ domain-containing protein [Ekhidna sp.]|uniref:S41 family peptidase n=1 Tax=Ekhidna sp. TaxID=2608089 RepID=UPI0032ED8DE5